MKSCKLWLTAVKVHAVLALLWLSLAIPSVTLWRNSVPWLVFISVYANVSGHWGAYQGAKAEREAGS